MDTAVLSESTAIRRHRPNLPVRKGGRKDEDRQMRHPRSALEASRLATPSCRQRVLLADADKRFCADACSFLSQHGCHVRAVGTHRALVHALGAWKPSTLFLSSTLPDLDLLEIAEIDLGLPADYCMVLLVEPCFPEPLTIPRRTSCIARLAKASSISEMRYFV